MTLIYYYAESIFFKLCRNQELLVNAILYNFDTNILVVPKATTYYTST